MESYDLMELRPYYDNTSDEMEEENSLTLTWHMSDKVTIHEWQKRHPEETSALTSVDVQVRWMSSWWCPTAIRKLMRSTNPKIQSGISYYFSQGALEHEPPLKIVTSILSILRTCKLFDETTHLKMIKPRYCDANSVVEKKTAPPSLLRFQEIGGHK